jgi:DNA-directed RNA polymerase subunit N (RpoN/RPB10)|tara:strand:+ start:145 stop:387 length:243 start_codon:yes stop_codon:yes gene_type:complete
MIIPIRCFSCNKVIGDKYAVYLALNNNIESDSNLTTIDTNLINSGSVEKSEQGKILDNLGIKRYCCRRMFLTQVDIVDVI